MPSFLVLPSSSSSSSSASCPTCFSLTGLNSKHESSLCPLRASLQCRRCHSRGHTSHACDLPWAHWERPTSLEELIPWDVREQWGIQTQTDLLYSEPRGAHGTDRELPFEVEVSKLDKPMRAFMKDKGIQTTHDTESNLQRIRDWALQHGVRLRLV